MDYKQRVTVANTLITTFICSEKKLFKSIKRYDLLLAVFLNSGYQKIKLCGAAIGIVFFCHATRLQIPL